MKIAFEGTHITGKTTLLEEFKQLISYENGVYPFENKSFGYISGIARSIISRGFPLNKDGNIDSYVNFINDQLEAEKWIQKYDIFISDRTLLSPLAYSLINRSLPRPYIPDYFISMIENIWLLEKQRYDLYIYFPIEFTMQNKDNIHLSDNEYRIDIDHMIHNLLETHCVDHIHMTGTREERLNSLVSIIRKGY
jgi:nicotinamide riboside kinase